MGEATSRVASRQSVDVALLSFAGLGELSARELELERSKIDKISIRGYDLLTTSLDSGVLARLANLRTVEDVFLVLGPRVEIRTKRDLRKLTKHINQETVLAALQVKNQIFPASKRKRRQVTFKCFVKQDRDYPIRRSEIEAKVEESLSRAFPRWRVADPASVEIWAFFHKNAVRLGFRLSSSSMRYHGRKPANRKGALRPTIAGALVFLAGITEGERVIDPMCGSGALVAEMLDLRVASLVLGGDVDSDATSIAKGLQCDESLIARWDCRHLPLADSVLHCLVSNLPFGRQYSTAENLPEFYLHCLAEWQRVLVSDGRIILLTSERHAIELAISQRGLRIVSRRDVKVLGLTATVYQISCRKEGYAKHELEANHGS